MAPRPPALGRAPAKPARASTSRPCRPFRATPRAPCSGRRGRRRRSPWRCACTRPGISRGANGPTAWPGRSRPSAIAATPTTARGITTTGSRRWRSSWPTKGSSTPRSSSIARTNGPRPRRTRPTASRSSSSADGRLLELDLDEHELGRIRIPHVMLDAGGTVVWLSGDELGGRDRAAGSLDRERSGRDRHDDVVVLVAMPSGGSAGREAPFGDTDTGSIDLHGGHGRDGARRFAHAADHRRRADAGERRTDMGENITLTSEDGFKLSAYRAKPTGKARGGLVVVQEIFGVNHHIRNVADGFAADGYDVIAPALFDRVEKNFETGYQPADIERGREARGKLQLDHAVMDTRAAVRELKKTYAKV